MAQCLVSALFVLFVIVALQLSACFFISLHLAPDIPTPLHRLPILIASHSNYTTVQVCKSRMGKGMYEYLDARGEERRSWIRYKGASTSLSDSCV